MKDFFIQLFTITVGILIALGLEQSVEAYHHHALANEARANILNETRNNKQDLSRVLAQASEQEQQYQHAVDVLGQFIDHKHPKGLFTLGYATSDLSSTSWATAQSTGALNFMSYQEVKEFNSAYTLQEQVVHQQQELFQTYEFALAGLAMSNPETMSTQELQDTRQQVRRALAGLFVLTELRSQLNRRYAAVLSKYNSRRK